MFRIIACLGLAWLSTSLELVAQERYWLKIQPQEGAAFRYQSTISITLNNGAPEPTMSSQMEHYLSSQVQSVTAQEITLLEKIERIKGVSQSMGRAFEFDTQHPTAGNPTMSAQMEQLVNKELRSIIKPNGAFISGTYPQEMMMGQGGSSEFRTITGNARFPDFAVKVGDTWTVIDTIRHQGMVSINTTQWVLQEVRDGLAVLSASGTGQLAGNPNAIPGASFAGTVTSVGTSKVELVSGISRASSQKVTVQINLDYEGQKQVITSVTESVSKLLN